ncbi:MAG: hypothetical protein JNK32_07585 [Anaerolineales bacterium]|nr:hypothetical protein [Anaerolineales bacterium]
MSRGVKIIIGIIVVLVCLCAAVMLFVNWANSEEGQAAMNEISTQQAVASATAAVETQQASGTATATWSEIEARLQNITLVHENTFEEGTPLVNEFGEDLDPFYRDGIPEIIVAWNGYTILPIGKPLTDFVAEVDCMASGAFCGIAYSVNKNSDGRNIFYASGIGNADQFFFDDRYASLPSSNWEGQNFPPSTTEGFLHHLRLERFGEVMRFYVNGERMEERLLTDPEAVSGDVGFYFGKSGSESGIQYIQVDNFRVWELP